MGDRSVHELPVRILTDEELINEYDRTFLMVVAPQSNNGDRPRLDEVCVRRNAAALGELVLRGYRATAPVWLRQYAS